MHNTVLFRNICKTVTAPKEDTENVRASHLLKQIEAASHGDTISVGEFVSMLGDRSFALAILIFSLPNSLPVPGIPGFSTVTGLPILFIALQLIAGKHTIWLPKRVAEKTFSQAFLKKIVTKAMPVVLWLEKFLHPRLGFVCGPIGERVIGLLIATMAFILVLPIVGGNFLPGASISLLALALLENDGIFASFSMAFCLLSLWLMYSIVVWALKLFLTWALSFF